MSLLPVDTVLVHMPYSVSCDDYRYVIMMAGVKRHAHCIKLFIEDKKFDAYYYLTTEGTFVCFTHLRKDIGCFLQSLPLAVMSCADCLQSSGVKSPTSERISPDLFRTNLFSFPRPSDPPLPATVVASPVQALQQMYEVDLGASGLRNYAPSITVPPSTSSIAALGEFDEEFES